MPTTPNDPIILGRWLAKKTPEIVASYVAPDARFRRVSRAPDPHAMLKTVHHKASSAPLRAIRCRSNLSGVQNNGFPPSCGPISPMNPGARHALHSTCTPRLSASIGSLARRGSPGRISLVAMGRQYSLRIENTGQIAEFRIFQPEPEEYR